METDYHHYTVVRDIWTDSKGYVHMSPLWQIRCLSCDWRGERITMPSRVQSKDRMRQWATHRENA